MVYRINRNSTFKEGKDIESIIGKELDRYLSIVEKYNELDYVFLKSVIYAEELLKQINFSLHGTDKYIGLKIHIEQIKLIKGEERLDKSIILLERVKKFRDKIAHDLDYEVKNDKEFLKEFKIEEHFTPELNKLMVIVYFKDINHGLLLMKAVLESMDNLLYFSIE